MHGIHNRPPVRGRPDEQWAPGDGRKSASASSDHRRHRPSSSHSNISTSSKTRPTTIASLAPPPLQLPGSPGPSGPPGPGAFSSASPGAGPAASVSSSASASASASTPAGVVLRSPPTQRAPASSSATPRNPRRSAGRPSPFLFPLFFGAAPATTTADVSSTSLVPSTAEGRPTSLDDGTAALRELNTSFPSNVYRHRFLAKSAGTQSKTYSQPVIVRTYSGPPAGHSSASRTPSSSRPGSERRLLPAATPGPSSLSTAVDPEHPGQRGPAATAANGNGAVNNLNSSNNLWASSRTSIPNAQNMPRPPPPRPSPAPKKKKRFPLALPWGWGSAGDGSHTPPEDEPPKYPPLEAFSMKGMIQARLESSDLGTDLDRIAELYARSKYSLSNQYDVHVAPHGSGEQLVTSSAAGTGAGPNLNSGARRRGTTHRSHHRQVVGPTLQATWSEEDGDGDSAGAAVRTHRKRRSGGGGRRKSAAMGTLETIMSSSRSSEEDKTKKKSASELTEIVRGRAARTGESSASAADQIPSQPQPHASGTSSGTAAGAEASSRTLTAPAPAQASTLALASVPTANATASPVELNRDAPGRSRRTRDKTQGGQRTGASTGTAAEPSLVRKKSTSFAHAVTIDSSRQQQQQQQQQQLQQQHRSHHHNNHNNHNHNHGHPHPAYAGAGTRHGHRDYPPPRGSAAALLVSEPALPQTYVDMADPLETTMAMTMTTTPRTPRTSTHHPMIIPEEENGEDGGGGGGGEAGRRPPLAAQETTNTTTGDYPPHQRFPHQPQPQPQHQYTPQRKQAATNDFMFPAAVVTNGLLAGLNGWIPWRGSEPAAGGGDAKAKAAGSSSTTATTTTTTRPSHAEGSLRELLKTAEGSRPVVKGKGVERTE